MKNSIVQVARPARKKAWMLVTRRKVSHRTWRRASTDFKGCNSFALSPDWKDNRVAQLYTTNGTGNNTNFYDYTNWERSGYRNSQWTLYTLVKPDPAPGPGPNPVRPSGVDPVLDCELRNFTLSLAKTLLTVRNPKALDLVHEALQLGPLCKAEAPGTGHAKRAAKPRHVFDLGDIYVDVQHGNDHTADGTVEHPFKSISAALTYRRTQQSHAALILRYTPTLGRLSHYMYYVKTRNVLSELDDCYWGCRHSSVSAVLQRRGRSTQRRCPLQSNLATSGTTRRLRC